MNNTRNTKNRICAICIDTETIPVNPKTPAMSAITKNVRAQCNMIFPNLCKYYAINKDNEILAVKFHKNFQELFLCTRVVLLFGIYIRPKNMKGFVMSALKLTLCGAVAALGLLSVSANAEGWGHMPRYSGYHSPYEGMLSLKQKVDLHNYLQYEQREPCQNYKPLPTNFYQDGCDLMYRYPSMGQASLERIVLASYVIEFAFDSSLIEDKAEPVLAKIANEINKYHPGDVTVSGYTDSHGAADYNIALSQRRADSVSKVLNARGVPNRTLGSEAYGETNQAVQTQDGVALRANRRVIVEFLK